MSDPRPIGVFDSGVGGLTVLREILRRSPAESTIYLGDNARAPYGVRPDDEVLAFSTQALDALVERDVKALVVACNTSTAVGLGAISGAATTCRSSASSGPGASAAALATRNRRVGVIATPATIRSHAYFDAIKDENPAVEVYEHATPALVPLVEAGELRGPGRRGGRRARRSAPLLGERDADGEFDLPAAAGGDDRHAAPRLHALPAAPPAHRGRRRRPGRDRRLRHGDRVRARRAARDQRARGAGHDARDGGRRRRRGHDRPDERRSPRTSSSRPATRTASARSRRACSAPPSRTSSRSSSRSRLDEPSRRTGAAGVARRPRLAGRVPRRLGARRRRDRRRAARRAVGAARASSTGRRSSGSPSAGSRARPGALTPAELRGRRAGLRRGDGADRAGALGGRSGRTLPGVVERSGVVDRAGWVRANIGDLRVAHRQARGGPARPGRAARRRPRPRRRWRSPTAG